MTTTENPSSALQAFDFKGNPVRTLTRDNQPWFVASDVCRVLDLANPRQVISSLHEQEKGVHKVDTLGGEQSVNIINESGLYALIFKSRKAQALAFRLWVTSEVLPNIRKHGFYLQNSLDFEKYPVAKEFSDIFVWLRGLSVDPNEAAGVARAILTASLRERRRELPQVSTRSDEEQMARRDMQRLIELAVSYMRGEQDHVLELHGAIHLARKHRLFLWIFGPSDARQVSSSTRISFGILLNRYSGRAFQIGAESFSFTRQGSKNVRKYVISRLTPTVS